MRKKGYSIDQLRFGFGYTTKELTEHSKRVAFLFAFIKSTSEKQFKTIMKKWKEHNRYLDRKKMGTPPRKYRAVGMDNKYINKTPSPALN